MPTDIVITGCTFFARCFIKGGSFTSGCVLSLGSFERGMCRFVVLCMLPLAQQVLVNYHSLPSNKERFTTQHSYVSKQSSDSCGSRPAAGEADLVVNMGADMCWQVAREAAEVAPGTRWV